MSTTCTRVRAVCVALALAAPLSAAACRGKAISLPFATACAKENEDKLVSIEGVLVVQTSLRCQVSKYDHKRGVCDFNLRSADGSSDVTYSLEIAKGSGDNEVAVGGNDRPGFGLYDPGKVVFTDQAGKKFKFEDRIRVAGKLHVDPPVHPTFPPSCTLEANSLEFVATAAPGDREERVAARHAGEGDVQSKVCAKGDDISISGIEKRVTVTGECGSVAVSGSGNQVTVEAAGRISVSGVQNSVVWRREIDGKPPKISKSGMGAEVEHKP